MILYSIVVPIYNEKDNIAPLVQEIEWVMHGFSWELIFVDDGSTDTSKQVLTTLSRTKPHIRAIFLKSNYGQSNALAAGIRASLGTWVITLDGDGQNDPRDIPLLIAAAHDCDMVSGIRKKRKDSLLKRLISRLANAVRSRLLKDKTTDTGCSLKLYRRSCFEKIPLYKGMHRFLPALFQIEGFTTKEIPVNHRPRERGSSKYTLFNRGISTLVDLFAVAWMKKRRLTYEIEREL